jgi:hypothetical protein
VLALVSAMENLVSVLALENPVSAMENLVSDNPVSTMENMVSETQALL